MVKLLVLHGPNLQLLGERRPDLYGRAGLEQINARLPRPGDGIRRGQLPPGLEALLDLLRTAAAREEARPAQAPAARPSAPARPKASRHRPVARPKANRKRPARRR